MRDEGSPAGTCTAHGVGHDYGPLRIGQRYRIIKPFRDFDGAVHPVGEAWTYIGTAFLPYDDGRSIFVSVDGVGEWHIRMQDRPEEQGPILDAFADYVAAITSS
jgi:hypothetical protein